MIWRMVRWLWVAALVMLALPLAANAQADERCFPETGFCISGRLRQFWEQNGGLPVFGFPIGPQQVEQVEGRPVLAQWFERNRLELHLENAAPYDVLLGRLGADRLAQQGRDWYGFGKSGPRDGCRFFAETGHNVCGAILAAWRNQGLEFDGRRGASEAESLALFGLPLSDEMTETMPDGQQRQVQWFERARFELHPENAAPYNVLLGLLGREIREAPAAAPAPTATPAPAPTAPAIQPPEVLNGYRKRMPEGYWTTSVEGVRMAAAGFSYRDKIGRYREAGKGYKYVTLTMAVFNDGYKDSYGDDTVFANAASFSLIDLDNHVYNADSATYALDNTFDGGDIYPGTSVSGGLVFRIPADSAPAIIVYDTSLRITLDLRTPPLR